MISSLFGLPFGRTAKALSLTAALCITACISAQAAPDSNTATAQSATASAPATAAPAPATTASTATTSAAAPAANSAASPIVLPEIIATIDSEPIKKAELERVATALLSLNGKQLGDLSTDDRNKFYKAVISELITDRLISKQAAKTQVTDAEVDKQFNGIKAEIPKEKFEQELKKSGQTVAEMKGNIRSSLRQQRWLESQLGNQTKVTDAEAEAYFKAHPDEFREPEKVRADHILVLVPANASADVLKEKLALANSIKDRLNKGESFADLAKQYSGDTGTKDKGGDLGFFDHDQMVPEFADAAFKLQKGQTSDPVKTIYGFHIIKVEDRQAAHQATYPEVKTELEAYLTMNKRRQLATELIKKLRDQSKIQINVAEQ